ncbi:hypothetical protein L1049_012445 [Liquidambar formosana]|uniref:MULE transposase domain-containing protein n=1 Tax=Liquidambar formosana TaxID=63359 RepID=A0AAP0N8Z4_LIQFO
MTTGFNAGCRPFIGLDGCFLKTSFGGQLLSAVGRDGNNQMFPLAIAIVEAETKETWTWFIGNLLHAIGCGYRNSITFISDRQKGLVDTFEELLPDADHRYCIRHLYANFKALYKGQALKDELWWAATSYRVHDFEKYMETIKELDTGAYDWLKDIDPCQWSRAYFNPRSNQRQANYHNA